MKRGKVWTSLPQKKEDLIKALNGMPDEMGIVICDGYEETITPIVDVVVENVAGVGKECIVLVGAHPMSKDNNINKQENTGISDLWNILDKSRYTEEGIKQYEEEYLFLKGVVSSLGIENTRKLLNMFDVSFGETYKMIVHLTGIDKESESEGNSNALNKLINAGKAGDVK